jgi:hypothetical protein
MWTPILIAAGGCYALKLAGLSVPRRLLDGPRARRGALLLPVALLAALIATQARGTRRRPGRGRRTRAVSDRRGRRRDHDRAAAARQLRKVSSCRAYSSRYARSS